MVLILSSLAPILGILLVIAFTTLLERKVLAGIQRRRAPSLHTVMGLAQPILDGVKLALKGVIFATATTLTTFILPLAGFLFLVFILGGTLPTTGIAGGWASVTCFSLLQFALFSGGLLICIILVTLVTTNAWTRLGSVRVLIAMLSYELIFAVLITLLAIMGCFWGIGGADMTNMGWTSWGWLPLWGMVAVADIGRAPVDVGEAESELVSGVNTEHGGLGFAVFFLGEYGHLVVLSIMLGIILGGCGIVGTALGVGCITGIIIARGAFPRVRVDQLLRVAWTWGLPIAGLGGIWCIGSHGMEAGWMATASGWMKPA